MKGRDLRYLGFVLFLGVTLVSGCALYPPGPVIKDYESSYNCFLPDWTPGVGPTVAERNIVEMCNEPETENAWQQAASAWKRAANGWRAAQAPEAAREAAQAGWQAAEAGKQATEANPEAPPAGNSMESAVACATATEKVYGGFLLCREKKQILAGVGIGALAASGAAVAASGISSVAAVSLGGAAGAGLGFDYMIYNKAKTQAYANAIVRLQCVVTEVSPLRNKSPELTALDLGVGKIDESLGTAEIPCFYKSEAEYAQYRLAVARYGIAKRRKAYAQEALSELPDEVVSAVKTVDVRAFAASQSGVPDSDQIAKGAQATTAFLKPPSTGQAVKSGPRIEAFSEQLRKEGKPPLSECSAMTQKLETETKRIDGALAKVRLPDPNFAECFAIKAYEEAASGATKTSTTGNSSKSNNGGKQSGGGGGSLQTSQRPNKIAFQILPSDIVYIDKTKPSASPDAKIVGGTPPYYIAVVDPGSVGVVQASQNDLFVGLQINLLNMAPKEQPARILVADQAGAEETIYVKAVPKKPATVTPPNKHVTKSPARQRQVAPPHK